MKPVSGRIRVMGWVLLAGVLFLTGAAARAGSIIGTVTEPDGVTGMQNVTVEAYRDNGSGWDWAASADTGADGTYEIGGLSAGTYRVWFHDWNGTYVGEVYDDVPGSDVWDSGTEIEVGEAGTVGGIDASLAVASMIAGTVTGMDGLTGLEGMAVTAYRWTGAWWGYAGSVNTDVDGRYELVGLAAGTYRVRFEDWNENYAGEVYDDVPGWDVWDSGTEIEVGEGATVGGIDASLEEYARLSGMVMRADGVTPIAGVRVCLVSGGGVAQRGQTDAGGAFAFSQLHSGAYTVVAQPSARLGVLGEWYDDGGLYVPGQDAPPAGATVITLASGEVREGIQLDLDPAGRISGQVMELGGAPLAGGCVKAKNGTLGLVSEAVVGESGGYELMGLLPGSHTLKAGAEAFADEWWEEATHEDRATALAVGSGSDLTCDFELRAGQNPAMVEVVSDPAGASVYLDYQATAHVTPVVLDVGEAASRSVWMGGWEIASHVITLKMAGCPRPAPRGVPAVEAETVTVSLDMTSGAEGSLSVATEPEGAEVFIDQADEAEGVTPLVVGSLAPGSHTILLSKEGWLQARPIVARVEAGATNEIFVPLASGGSPERMMAEVRSAPTGAVIYVDYRPTAEVTDGVVDWMDPASHAGPGWRSASHTVMLRKRDHLPGAPRYVPEVVNVVQTNPVELIVDTVAVADEDGDGMPDQWEDGYDLPDGWEDQTAEDDFDGDGASNRDELIAGTHPGDRDSVFEIGQSGMESPGGNGRVTFVFDSTPGRFYLIQGAASFGDSVEWINLSGAIRATAHQTTQAASMGGMRFFRLLVWAP